MTLKAQLMLTGALFGLTTTIGSVTRFQSRLVDSPPPQSPQLPRGSVPPGFVLRDLNQDPIVLSNAIAAKPIVILTFWATWCRPCLLELAALRDFLTPPRTTAISLLAINVGEPELTVAQFVSTHQIPGTVLLDADRSITRAYSVDALPSTVIVENGLVAHTYRGFSPHLIVALEELLPPE